ncbi:MAG: tetratricopeptide repeat protein [bacterium]
MVDPRQQQSGITIPFTMNEKNQPSRSREKRTNDNGKWSITAFSLLVILLLYLTSELSPNFRLWGINHLAYLPRLWRVILTLLAVSLIIPPVQDRIVALFHSLRLKYFKKVPLDKHVFIVAGILSLPMFWYFRVSTVLLGDGQLLVTEALLVQKFSSFLKIFPIAFGTRTPLSAAFYYLVSRIGQGTFQIPPEVLFQMISCLAGGILLYALLNFAFTVIQRCGLRVLFITAFLSQGAILLYFGYIEYYTLLHLCSSLFLLAALKAIAKGSSHWPATIWFILTLGIHFLAIIHLPIYLLFLLLLHRTSLDRFLTIRWIATSLGIFLLLFAIGLFLSGEYQLRRNFLPVVSLDVRISYTMFSLQHLADYMNGIVLSALLGIVLLIVSILFGARQIRWNQKEILLLIPALFFTQFFNFVANTDIGFARDWDLTASLGVPAVLLGVWLFGSADSEGIGIQRMSLTLFSLLLLTTIPWIAVNSSKPASFARFENILEMDKTNVGEDRTAYGYETLAIQSRIEKIGRGEPYYLAKAVESSDNMRYYENLVIALNKASLTQSDIPLLQRVVDRFHRELIDSAADRTQKRYRDHLTFYYVTLRLLRENGGVTQAKNFYDGAVQHNLPEQGYAYIGLGEYALLNGNFMEAAKWYNRVNVDSLELVPRDLRLMAMTYDSLRRFDRAEKIYENWLKLEPESESALLGLGRVKVLSGEREQGRTILRKYLERFSSGQYRFQAEELLKSSH